MGDILTTSSTTLVVGRPHNQPRIDTRQPVVGAYTQRKEIQRKYSIHMQRAKTEMSDENDLQLGYVGTTCPDVMIQAPCSQGDGTDRYSSYFAENGGYEPRPATMPGRSCGRRHR
jgi:hypothetical protein